MLACSAQPSRLQSSTAAHAQAAQPRTRCLKQGQSPAQGQTLQSGLEPLHAALPSCHQLPAHGAEAEMLLRQAEVHRQVRLGC